MTTPFGYATLQFIPSLAGVPDAVERQLKGMPGLGKNAGKLLGTNIASGIKASESDVKRAMDGYAKLYDKAADATGKLRAEEAKLKDLQDRGVTGGRLVTQSERAEKARRDEARAVRDARDSYREYESAAERAASAGSSGGGLLDKLKGLAGSAKSSGGEAATGFVEGFGGPIASLGTKAGPIGLALAAAAALGVGAGALIAKQVMAGMEQEQQQANVAAKLGLSAEQMKPIADASAAAYASNFGESVASNMDAARAAIQSGLLDPSATQADVQAMVQQLSTVSDVMGEEIPATARAAQQAIRTGLAGNATEAFDLFTKAQQSGLNVSEDFLDTVTEYGTQFRKLGLSGPEAIGLISQAVKGGARDTDVAADALKEFSIRAVDGSKTTTDAFSALGLNADEMAAKFAAGGPTAKAAFDQVTDAVRGIDDPVKKASVSVGLFGTQSEDLGGALDTLDLSSAVDQLGQVDGAAQRAADTMGNTTASSVEGAKRSIETASNSMQQSLAAAFGPALQEGANWIVAHQEDIKGAFTFIANGALEFGGAVTGVVGSVVTGFGYLVSATGDTVGFMLDGFEQMTGAAATVADAVGADGIAADLRGAQSQLGVWSDQFHGWGEGLVDTGNKITEAGIKLHDLDLNAQGAGNSAAGASPKVQALATALNTIPNNKETIISLNDAAAHERAQQLADIIGRLPGAKQINIDAVVVYKDTAGIVIPPDQLRAPVRAPAVPGDTYNGPGRAGGGMIPGFSTVDDRLGITPKGLIGLAGGEGIVNAPATRRLGGKPFIDFLNGFAEGGVVPGGITVDSLKRFAAGISGHGYVWGGGNGDTFDTDCSGAQSTVANYLTGGKGRFATASEASALASRGFRTGDPPAGVSAYWVGWINGGPGGGHTAGTIVDPAGGNVNVEMGGSSGGGAYGGKAAGASGFPNRAWFPIMAGDDPSKDSFSGGSSPFAGGSASAAVTGGGDLGGFAKAGGATTSNSGGGGSISLPSSLSGFGAFAGEQLGKLGGDEKLGKLGSAAGSLIDGQVASALDVFGIPSDPPWLKAISTFIGGISIGGGGGSAGPLAASPKPYANVSPGDAENMHGNRAGQAPGPTYNITARDTEDAFVKAQRIEREKAATKLSRF